MTLPLSKTLHPDDYEQLPHELAIVDKFFTTEREQNIMRRWEYSMALRALMTWQYGGGEADRIRLIADVGGAGSPFWHMVADTSIARQVVVIDPEINYPLERYFGYGAPLMSAVFCLSVLEHVDDLDRFLYHLSCLVAPGGLLFLTMDCCGCGAVAGQLSHPPEVEQHMYHWMRKRIFRVEDWAQLIHTYHLFPTFQLLGGEDDWRYHGNFVHDYTFSSLALVKRA